MAIKLNGTLSRCFEGPALGALIAIAFVPTAMAQWMPPWGAAFPGEIEQSLEAQGYVLTAPLMRRPGVYLADVSAGPAGHQRLIIDARSGQILERFTAPGRNWGPALAARDEEFGEPQDRWRRTAAQPRLFRAARSSRTDGEIGLRRSSERPYSRGRQPLRRRGNAGRNEGQAKVRSRRNARRPSTRLCRLPLHVKRRKWTDQARRRPSRPRTMIPSSRGINSLSTNVGNGPPASAPTTQGPSTEASDKPKVSIVPPALFQ